MESGSYCAYNVSLNLLLSERVAAVSEILDPLDLLALLLNGPGTSRQSAVFAECLAGISEWPRLFAVDFAYLGEEQMIVESGTVGPGTCFPPLPDGVTGVLFLADGRLEETGSTRGNVVRICAKSELTAETDAASYFSAGSPETHMEVQTLQNQAQTSLFFEAAKLPEFVFEPFIGSLMYLPEPVRPAAQSTEYFLTREELERPLPTSMLGPMQARASEVVIPEPIQSKDAAEQVAEPAPPLHARESEAVPAVSHGFAPSQIRFFDPAAVTGGQEQSAEEKRTEANEEAGPRVSSGLPPALKAAILLFDEQLRLEKELEKGLNKKEEKALGKKKSGKKRARQVEAETVAPAPEQAPSPAFFESPAVADATSAETIGEALPVHEQVAPVELPVENALQLHPGNAAEVASEPQSEIAAEPPAEVMASQPEPEIAAEPPAQLVASYPEPEPVEVMASQPEPGTVEVVASQSESETAEAVTAQPEPEIAAESPIEVAWEPGSGIPEPSVGVPADPASEVVVNSTAAFEETQQILEIEPAAEQIEFEALAEVEVQQVEPEESITQSAEQEAEPAPMAPVLKAALDAVEPKPAPVQEPPREIAKPEKQRRPGPESRKEKLSFGVRVQRWLLGEEGSQKRKSERVAMPGVVAFYWSGGAPKPHEVVNISKGGFYLRTKELWLPDTLVRMTLEKPNENEGEAKQTIRVLARVVRIDEGGVGHEFVTTEALLRMRTFDVLPNQGTNKTELENFLGKR